VGSPPGPESDCGVLAIRLEFNNFQAIATERLVVKLIEVC
jgi:hypothetical protein